MENEAPQPPDLSGESPSLEWFDVNQSELAELPGGLLSFSWIYPLPSARRTPVFVADLSALVTLYQHGVCVGFVREMLEGCGLGDLLRAVDAVPRPPIGFAYTYSACTLLTRPSSTLLMNHFPTARYGIHIVSFALPDPEP